MHSFTRTITMKSNMRKTVNNSKTTATLVYIVSFPEININYAVLGYIHCIRPLSWLANRLRTSHSLSFSYDLRVGPHRTNQLDNYFQRPIYFTKYYYNIGMRLSYWRHQMILRSAPFVFFYSLIGAAKLPNPPVFTSVPHYPPECYYPPGRSLWGQPINHL